MINRNLWNKNRNLTKYNRNGNHKEEEEKTQILDILSNPSFNKFSYQIGKMGSIEEDNLLVRESNEDYYIIKED